MISCFLLLLVTAWSQTAGQKEKLLGFARERSKVFSQQKQLAGAWARANGRPLVIETADSYLELQYLDQSGHARYYKTDNATAAATISSQKTYPAGGSGLDLTGNGITVSEWDAGSVLATHQEFGNRVTVVDAVATHYHSTHVAGTIMAAGITAAARGMAWEASLRSYDWNDDVAELATEGAAGRLITNHSYGEARGWYASTWYGDPAISTQEDYLFGFYDQMAHDWDLVAYYAPQMLICKSAGNDRNDAGTGYPADGPYDCIGNQGVAKNILTVGAVNDIALGYTTPSDVVMTAFSSWGPADDGRIKPDIVANGLGLYSTYNTNNTSYGTSSGTSMSSPSVAGSLALLQQHRQTLTGSPMLAATLKALVIHTADEAGPNPGPDYMFGWGLMNTLNAALKISEDQSTDVIRDLTLTDGATYTHEVKALGTEPLKVTLVWTDVPGTPAAPSLDPITPMVVNELDMRITRDAEIHYPWKLNRDNPDQAATRTSENNSDNVESITIDSPVAGAVYTIAIDHDGSLTGGSQPFSIVFSGIDNAVAPVAGFTADLTNPATQWPVSFTDLSQNMPDTWQWSFAPSTVTYLSGTTSATQNPRLQFNEPGNYTVSLTVSNSFGADAEVKTGYVTVLNCTHATLPWIEEFTTATLPDCWSQVDHQGNGQTWHFGTIDTHSPNPGLDGNYAFVDSDAFGQGNTQNADLVSPLFDLSNYTGVALQFSHFFREYAGSSATLSYSTDAGYTWTVLQTFDETTANPEVFQLVIPAVDMQPMVKFKWNYTGTWAYFWAVDEVAVSGTFTEIWQGVADSDWNNSLNWADGSAPGPESEVVITDVANQPIITAPLSNPVVVAQLTILAGASLTIAAEKALSVTENLTNEAGPGGLLIETDGSLIHHNQQAQATIGRTIGAWGSNPGQGWHLLSSPVEEQPFQPGFVPNPPTALEDFYLWQEPLNQWINSKTGEGPFGFNLSGFGSVFEPGRGYLVAYSDTHAGSFTGTINTTDQEMALTSTAGQGRQGWNLLGNPFASALAWDVQEWDPGNNTVGGVAKTLDSESGSYNDVIGGETIPSNSGFFVHAQTQGPFTIPAAARLHDGSGEKTPNPGKIVLQVTDKETGLTQKSQIVMDEASTMGYDPLFDGEFVRFHAPAFYSINGNYRLSTNAVPAIHTGMAIEFGFEKNTGSEYVLKVQNTDLVNHQVSIVDKKNGHHQNFNTQPTYEFRAEQGDDFNRFQILFESVGTNSIEPDPVVVFATGGRIMCQSPGEGTLEIFDLSGRLVFSRLLTGGKMNSFNSGLRNGGYLVKITTKGQVTVKKVVL